MKIILRDETVSVVNLKSTRNFFCEITGHERSTLKQTFDDIRVILILLNQKF